MRNRGRLISRQRLLPRRGRARRSAAWLAIAALLLNAVLLPAPARAEHPFGAFCGAAVRAGLPAEKPAVPVGQRCPSCPDCPLCFAAAIALPPPANGCLLGMSEAAQSIVYAAALPAVARGAPRRAAGGPRAPPLSA